jgi:glutamate 5-kinase
LYTADPARDPQAQLVSRVFQITPQIEGMAGGSGTEVGTGGMATKLAAARIALNAGCALCIASGRVNHPLRRIEEGTRCTWFLPSSSPLSVRKQWIASTLRPAGALAVDAGAVAALSSGKSLLPAGVVKAIGRFERGDTVSVLGPDGSEIARGISAYSDQDAARIMGRKSVEIESLLGYRGRDEMIHRDDLVWLGKRTEPHIVEQEAARPEP